MPYTIKKKVHKYQWTVLQHQMHLVVFFSQAFQQEIILNTAKIELALRQGEGLIEKSEPLDAAVIEEELEELQRYCQEVFGRVDRYYKKLKRLPVSQSPNVLDISCHNICSNICVTVVLLQHL